MGICTFLHVHDLRGEGEYLDGRLGLVECVESVQALQNILQVLFTEAKLWYSQSGHYAYKWSKAVVLSERTLRLQMGQSCGTLRADTTPANGANIKFRSV